MFRGITVFNDRQGDTLSVTPRGFEFSPTSWDPIITIAHGKDSRSVVFIEDEAPDIIAGIVHGLNLDVSKLYNIIGKVQDIIDQKECVSTFEHVTDGSPCPCGPVVENIT